MDEYYKFFNLKKLSDLLGIQPDKLYNNFRGLYNSLHQEDRERIANALIPNVEKLFDKLGYSVSFKKLKK